MKKLTTHPRLNDEKKMIVPLCHCDKYLAFK